MPSDSHLRRAERCVFAREDRLKHFDHSTAGPGPAYVPNHDTLSRVRRAPRSTIGKAVRQPFFVLPPHMREVVPRQESGPTATAQLLRTIPVREAPLLRDEL